jgi:hypothetical protein
MSYPAIVGAAGLVIVSVFTVTEHKPRITTNSEFSLAVRTGPDAIVSDEKPAAFIGLPTAPEGE